MCFWAKKNTRIKGRIYKTVAENPSAGLPKFQSFDRATPIRVLFGLRKIKGVK
jgi:hypothetical protein